MSDTVIPMGRPAFQTLLGPSEQVPPMADASWPSVQGYEVFAPTAEIASGTHHVCMLQSDMVLDAFTVGVPDRRVSPVTTDFNLVVGGTTLLAADLTVSTDFVVTDDTDFNAAVKDLWVAAGTKIEVVVTVPGGYGANYWYGLQIGLLGRERRSW